ncbi:MAG: hypothetical protein JO047_16380 [Alphaproteobacteria bacterium]|nr:hypothetical protein [Alphaproteobacteria bacterium]
MAKDDSSDMKQLGSDATQALGPLQKQIEDAFKTATLMAKNPNPKLAESLADKIEEIVSGVSDMRGLLKELQKASK